MATSAAAKWRRSARWHKCSNTLAQHLNRSCSPPQASSSTLGAACKLAGTFKCWPAPARPAHSAGPGCCSHQGQVRKVCCDHSSGHSWAVRTPDAAGSRTTLHRVLSNCLHPRLCTRLLAMWTPSACTRHWHQRIGQRRWSTTSSTVRSSSVISLCPFCPRAQVCTWSGDLGSTATHHANSTTAGGKAGGRVAGRKQDRSRAAAAQ